MTRRTAIRTAITAIIVCMLAGALAGLLADRFARPTRAQGGGDRCGAANGDTNGDGARDLSDAVYLLVWLFSGGPEPVPPCGGGPELEALRAEIAQCRDERDQARAELESCQAELLEVRRHLEQCCRPEDCGNLFDDDGDSFIDCADSDCAASPACATGVLVLNEVDYDQEGTDTMEFAEVLNAGATSVPLGGLALVFVNGLTSSEYFRIDLSPAGSLSPGQYLVVHQAAVQVAPEALSLVLEQAFTGIQNGSPDAVVLFDATANAVIDALSYEGAITAAVISGAPGTFDLVSGAATPAADLGQGSLSRLPDGADTGDDATDWALSSVPTPGAPNAP
ncbi:MAG: lamin tail domain-containing protein [Planctomycetes bacterium]|nr:lamin tail domain-containing protein [Planctomycetota bacterium]